MTIVMPGSLEEYFELLAFITRKDELTGVGVTPAEFNDMMPWQFELLLEFKRQQKEE
jgi:hypothetical protein